MPDAKNVIGNFVAELTKRDDEMARVLYNTEHRNFPLPKEINAMPSKPCITRPSAIMSGGSLSHHIVGTQPFRYHLRQQTQTSCQLRESHGIPTYTGGD